MINKIAICFLITIILFFAPVLSNLNASCLYEGRYGICVRTIDCYPLVEEVQAAGLPTPSRLISKLEELLSRCGYVGNERLLCCVNSLSPRIFVEDDIYYDATQHPNYQLLPINCGVTEEHKIFGGKIANLHEMLWMALLTYTDIRLGTVTKCGGTVISERYILTAAHCVTNLGGEKLVSVSVGEYNTATDPDCFGDKRNEICRQPVQMLTVESTVPHPNFSHGNLYDDIALVRLAKTIDFSKVGGPIPICLPHTKELQKENLLRAKAVAAGWGNTEFGYRSDILRIVDLPIWSNRECEDINKGGVRDSQICAGGEKDKDTCTGDSGGPLIYKGTVGTHGDRHVIRGISSIGTSICAKGFPSTFTRVSSYIRWILDNMKE